MAQQRAMKMDLYDAVSAIGNALTALADTDEDGQFQSAFYPAPDRLDVLPGRPSMTVRFDGIAGDDWNKYQEMVVPPKSPSDMRFELRIYHPSEIPSDLPFDTDPYVFAQTQVLEGTSAVYKGLREDNTLGELVMDILVLGSVAGDLVDPRPGGRTYYGHEIMLITSLY